MPPSIHFAGPKNKPPNAGCSRSKLLDPKLERLIEIVEKQLPHNFPVDTTLSIEMAGTNASGIFFPELVRICPDDLKKGKVYGYRWYSPALLFSRILWYLSCSWNGQPLHLQRILLRRPSNSNNTVFMILGMSSGSPEKSNWKSLLLDQLNVAFKHTQLTKQAQKPRWDCIFSVISGYLETCFECFEM